MSRITWGAQTLIDQVNALGYDATVERGEPDGLDVIRTITFTDARTASWLYPLLTVELDSRIASALHDTVADTLAVTFVSYATADSRDPFPLPEVDAVLNAPAEVQEPQEPSEPAESPVKVPAKKAAKRAPRKSP